MNGPRHLAAGTAPQPEPDHQDARVLRRAAGSDGALWPPPGTTTARPPPPPPPSTSSSATRSARSPSTCPPYGTTRPPGTRTKTT